MVGVEPNVGACTKARQNRLNCVKNVGFERLCGHGGKMKDFKFHFRTALLE